MGEFIVGFVRQFPLQVFGGSVLLLIWVLAAQITLKASR
jgi:hypothetical protein